MFCHGRGLRGGPVRALLVVPARAQPQERQLRQRRGAGIVRAIAQGSRLVVVQIAQRPGHAQGEDRVRGVEDLAPGAEILPQQDAPRLTGRGRVGVALVFLGEDRGVGQPEAVDRLLHVAHQEEVLPLPGDGAEDRVLHPAHVLILVHHDLGIAPGDLAGQLRGAAVLVREQRRRHVFEIGIVQQIGPALVLCVLRLEIQHQLQQGAHRGLGCRHVREQLVRGVGEAVREPVHGGLAGLAPLPDVFGGVGIVVFQKSSEGREGDGEAGSRLLPAERESAAQLTQRVGGPGKAVVIGLPDLLVLTDRGHHPVKFRAPVFGLLGGAAQQFPPPERLAHVRDLLPQKRDLLPGPALRPRVALHPVIEREGELGKAPVVPPGADRVGQQGKARLLVLPVVPALHRPLQRGGLHVRRPLLRGDAEVRAQSGAVRKFPQQRRAEAVDRADLRAAHQRALPPQTPVAGVCGQRLVQLLGDAAAQLSRGGAREGDDQEAVQIGGLLLVADIAQQALGEHPGLAAARAGGDQDGPAPALDGVLLCNCRPVFRHDRSRPSGRAAAPPACPRPPCRCSGAGNGYARRSLRR